MIDEAPLFGLILAGGHSSRMKFDKALAEYHGKSQIHYLIEILKPFCEITYVSRNPSQKHIDVSDAKIVNDSFENLQGPLNGIASAFKAEPNACWLVLPIDMPLMDQTILRYLTTNRDRKKLATCFQVSNLIEPFPSIWEKDCGTPLLDFIQNNGKSPKRFLERNKVHVLESPASEKFININTPEELELFKKSSTE